MLRRLAALLATCVAASAVVLAPLEAAPRRDYAASAWTILPPGENGSLTFDKNTRDQAKLYDALTPLFGQRHGARHPPHVQAGSARRAAAGRIQAREPSAGREDRPRRLRRRSREREDRGGRRLRSRLGDGGRSRAAAPAHSRPGAGRGARRAGARPAGARAVGQELRPERRRPRRSCRTRSTPCARSAESGRRSSRWSTPTRPGSTATTGRRGSRRRRSPRTTSSRRRRSSPRVSARTVGRRSQNAMFLDALEERLGDADARRVFADLREANDPEAPVSVPGSFPQEAPSAATPGSVVLDDGSFTGAPLDGACVRLERAARRREAVARRATRSSSPARRSGTSSRSSSRRWSSRVPASTCAAPCSRACRSSSSDAARTSRGARPRRRRTTSTSSSRRCATTTCTTCTAASASPCDGSSSGTLKAQGQPDQEISYDETTHGPVIGYAKVGGKRVAISVQRSTRGRELLSTQGVLRPEHRHA